MYMLNLLEIRRPDHILQFLKWIKLDFKILINLESWFKAGLQLCSIRNRTDRARINRLKKIQMAIELKSLDFAHFQ